MATNLLDQAINEVGGKEWSYEALARPRSGHLRAADIESSITLQDFLSDVCRKPEQVKTTTLIFDFHSKVPEFGGLRDMPEKLWQQRFDELPPCMSPGNKLPANSSMGVVINNLEDGTMNVMKIVHFADKVATNAASKYCTGEAYVAAFRSGPWAVRKAVQNLLDRIPGHFVFWHSVTQKKSASSLQRSNTSQWAPEDDELKAGVAFINEHAPECDAMNEQTLWTLMSIRETSGTPIAGWPESKVRMMCQNKSRGLTGATPQYHFPLQTYSLKPFVAEILLPLIYPLLLSFGFMAIGWPGVGKTPAIIVMALAMGRYNIRKAGLVKDPSWRRAKSLDNFRQRVPEIGGAIFLDDPTREKIDLADIKSFMCAEENQTCSGRYNDVKLLRNQMRAYAGNHLSVDDEPVPCQDTLISPDDFLKLMRHTFPGEKEADVMACLKRSVVMIFGKHALYLRFPSENEDAKIHRIVKDDVHKDLLAPHDKPIYGAYKRGSKTMGPNFSSDVQKEQNMIDESIATMEAHDSLSSYIKFCDSQIQMKVMRVRRLPSSSSDSSQGVQVQDCLPVPVRLAGHEVPRKRITNATKFDFGGTPKRRLKEKTTVDPVEQEPAEEQSIIEEPSSAVPVPEPEHQPEENEANSIGDEMDVVDGETVPDEEAARFLHE